MFAIIQAGGKQYRVEAGAELLVERLDGEPGAKHSFDQVLLISGEGVMKLGRPVLVGASVEAELLGEEKGPKLISLRHKAKKDVHKRRGHRQKLTRVRIIRVMDGTAKSQE